MNKSLKIYIVILVLILALVIAMDISKPKPINWEPTYGVNDKIPFGLYILNQELGKMTGQKVTKMEQSPYEYFESQYDYDTLVNNYKVKGTFLNISDYGNIDETSAQEILYFISHENTAFLSMKKFPETLLDSLKISMDADYKYSDKIYNWLANPKFGSKNTRLLKELAMIILPNLTPLIQLFWVIKVVIVRESIL